jgi:hypothetical protein
MIVIDLNKVYPDYTPEELKIIKVGQEIRRAREAGEI